MSLILSLLGCVWLMDRPPLCPESCPRHTACTSAGACPLTCSDDAGCEAGYHCDWIASECVEDCQEEACPGGYGCTGDSGCATECYSPSVCKEGYRCVDYRCVER